MRLGGQCSLCCNLSVTAVEACKSSVPSMADTDNMINIAQSELQKLIGEYATSIRESKETMIRKDSPQAHGPRMQYGLVAQATKTGMSVYDLDALANYNIAKDGEEREDGREGGLAVDDPEGNVVDLEAVGQVSYARSASIGVCDDYDFVPAIDEFT
jgi:hypothetical protein